MNSKKIIEKSLFGKLPYIYRLIEIVEIDTQSRVLISVEIKKIQCSTTEKYFYKPISRIQ